MEKRVLIERWIGSETQIPIYDEASVSSARQRVREIGQSLNLSKELVESVALIASELTHNQLSHARQGYFAVKPVEREGVKGIEIIAADIGPGIEKPGIAIKGELPKDGRSLRAGLAAVCRIADEVEFDTRIEEGARIVARKFETPAPSLAYEVAIMGRPFPGEGISGDDGVFLESETGFLAAVCDGLGHGPEAREASNRAIEALSQKRHMSLDRIVSDLNDELTDTRGCALNIVRFNADAAIIECASAGDVHAHLYNLRDAHFFASTPFIVGARQTPKRIRIEEAPVARGSVLVMFTDGLKSRTSLKGQLDILRQPAIAIAQHLIENDSRPDDDVLVLAARFHKSREGGDAIKHYSGAR
jgi:anti-sigma regulatory factor (Ser/Thr protein kinase)